MAEVTIVGWHLPDNPTTCYYCGEHATLMVVEGYQTLDEAPPFDICGDCLTKRHVMVKRDLIDEIFKKAGF